MSDVPQQILILLPYYNRPQMVRYALMSIARAATMHAHWHLAFIDDGSREPGGAIVEEILQDHMDKVTLYQTGAPIDPALRMTSTHGAFMNQAIRDHLADVCIMLCDDDALRDDYLFNLSKWFQAHPTEWSCYSNVWVYDPFKGPPWEQSWTADHFLNRHVEPILCSCNVDASQVAWRHGLSTRHNVWFLDEATRDLDARFYAQLNEATGPTFPTGFIGQYKGFHQAQLGGRGFNWADTGIDLAR